MDKERVGGGGRTRLRRERRGREREAQEVGCRDGVVVMIGRLVFIFVGGGGNRE